MGSSKKNWRIEIQTGTTLPPWQVDVKKRSGCPKRVASLPTVFTRDPCCQMITKKYWVQQPIMLGEADASRSAMQKRQSSSTRIFMEHRWLSKESPTRKFQSHGPWFNDVLPQVPSKGLDADGHYIWYISNKNKSNPHVCKPLDSSERTSRMFWCSPAAAWWRSICSFTSTFGTARQS